MALEIRELQFDDWNEAECARHGVTPVEVWQVLDCEPEFFPNKKPHVARYIMVGPTLGGRFLTVPLAETPVSGTWRPATAFDSNDHDRGRYRAAQGGSRHR